MILIEVGKCGLLCLALYPTGTLADANPACTCTEQWDHWQNWVFLLIGELWEEQEHPDSSGSVDFCPCIRVVLQRRE